MLRHVIHYRLRVHHSDGALLQEEMQCRSDDSVVRWKIKGWKDHVLDEGAAASVVLGCVRTSGGITRENDEIFRAATALRSFLTLLDRLVQLRLQECASVERGVVVSSRLVTPAGTEVPRLALSVEFLHSKYLAGLPSVFAVGIEAEYKSTSVFLLPVGDSL